MAVSRSLTFSLSFIFAFFRLGLLLRCFLLIRLERGRRKGPPEAGGGLESDPFRLRVVDVHVGEGDPDEELPALDAGHPLHPSVLHERRHLRRVRHRPTDRLEHVRGGLRLSQPHEAGGAVVAHLLHGGEREEAAGEVELLEQIHRLLLADLGAVVDLGALAVGVDHRLRRHRRRPLVGAGGRRGREIRGKGGRWSESARNWVRF